MKRSQPDFRSETGDRRFRGVLLILLVLLSGFPPLHAQQAPLNTVEIGTVSRQIDESSDGYGPFTDYLESRQPGYRFQVRKFQSIQDLMAAVEAQTLDFAFISPAAYVELSLDSDLRILSTITRQVNDSYSPWLAGAVITMVSRDDIATLADAAGTRVVALSEIALGSWLSAVREWQDMGIDANADFASLEFVLSYASVVAAVCSGNADIGVIAANTLPSFTDRCSQDLKVLPPATVVQDMDYPLPHSTRLYPEMAFVMVGRHDEEFIRLLTNSLLDMEQDGPAARAVNISGFTAPLQYSEVQALMQELRLGPYSNLGELTLRQLLLQNIYPVTLGMLILLALISFGLVKASRLSRKYRESEDYRKRLFEGSHIPMVVVDLGANAFLDMNPAAARQYGYRTKEDLVGQSLMTVSDSEQDIETSIEDAFENVRKQVIEEGFATFTWRHIRPNGEKWLAKIHLMIFDSPNGKLIQATVDDITEQKKQEEERRNLEQQLEFSQRMESIGRLAGGIAHDFNNLLTIINGYCEVLLMELSTDKSAKIVQQIRKAGIRASELTQQLLTFSRRQAIRHVPVDLNRVVLEAAEMLRSVLGEDIRLELKLTNSPCRVLSDPGQLQQVLVNLVVNAKDAMPEGGVLKIGTKETFITPRNAKGMEISAGDYIEITVADSGIGIKADILQHIFEPFFTTKADTGTGLGLSMVYGIVQQSFGTVLVNSVEGKGSTFRILLPATDDEEHLNADEKVEFPTVTGSSMILVVEDQEEVRDYATSVLRRAGYRVVTASSGNGALTRLETMEERVHLLLTDVVMEGMSGGELAKSFNETYPDIPVLFTSGYPGDELARYGVRQGTHDFLPKPFSPKELLERVEDILKNAAVLS